MQQIVDFLADGLQGLALFGAVYALLAGAWIWGFRPRPLPGRAESPPVSLLRPLHGWEPGLERALDSTLIQEYSGPVQIVIGVQDAADAALSVVERVRAAHPHEDVSVVVDSRLHGANRKISNLINMAAHARHEVIVLADSDIVVGRDYLSRVVAALAEPGVGVVTCPYYGEARAGVWSRLAAMGISDHFLPSLAVGVSLRMAKPCMGSTIALRREVLDEIGGLNAFADVLADDYAIGQAVRAAGYRSVVAPILVAHGCDETSFEALIAHELRWARTIRGVDPWGFFGSGLTHAMVFALAAVLLMRGSLLAFGVLGLVVACRIWLVRQVRDVTGTPHEVWWLTPMRDMLSFGVFLGSFFVRTVDWRGTRFRVDRHGDLSRI